MENLKTLIFVFLISSFAELYTQGVKWVYRYDSKRSGPDYGYSLVYGEDGNIYAAGKSFAGLSPDFTILSLMPSGNERWVYTYNGTGNSTDCATSLIYGDDGNIYAVGSTKENTSDITIVSLTSSGNERWIYHYNGPADSSDYAYSIIYGADGNLYIVGESYGIGSKRDLVVISLTSQGNERWVYRFNGQGNSDDGGYSITYGTDGNIYIAGYMSTYTDVDFLVLSLDNQGNQRWFYLYDCDGKNDYALSIVYGADGYLYAAGYSRDNSDDVVLIKLSNSGMEEWVYRYDGPAHGNDRATDLVYGMDGNIYLSGETWGGNDRKVDLLALSVDNNGGERWVYFYDALCNEDDYAYSITYGENSNIYIAGYSNGNETKEDLIVLSLDNQGNELWVYRYNGSANESDSGYGVIYGLDGNIYMVGCAKENTSSNDFLIISLNNQGIERWIYNYDGWISGRDAAYSITYGLDGHIYACGGSEIFSLSKFMVISIDTNGIERWVYQYNGTGEGNECANSIVYGLDDNLYIAGQCYDTATGGDFSIISLTNFGNERWVYRYDGKKQGDWATELVYGEDGNIYAVGTSWEGDPNSYDFLIISITSNGSERWVYRYDGPESLSVDHGISIVYGLDGNIYAAGYGGNGAYLIVVSLTSSGTLRWIYHYNGVGDGEAAAFSITYGTDNNIYIAGYEYVTSLDFLVISLDTSGQMRWKYSYNGPGNGPDCAEHLIYGEDGNVYVVGYTEGNGTNLDFTIVSLTPNGEERWIYRYNTPGNASDYGKYIVWGEENIYGVGGSYGNNSEIIITSLDTSGYENWVYLYNGDADSIDFGYQIAYTQDNYLYIAGTSTQEINKERDFVVLKFDPYMWISEKNMKEKIKLEIPLIHNKNITFYLSFLYRGEIQINIFDLVGRKVYDRKIFGDGKRRAYNFLHSLSTGIYFLKIKIDKKEIRKKIMLLK